MKRKFLTIAFILSGIAAMQSCQNESKTEKDSKHLSTDLVTNPASANGMDTTRGLASIDFTDTTHNFGTITDGESVSHDFQFKNNGTEPLLIISASGSCGCTVPEFPHEPVPPGGSGVMKVTFNSKGKVGHQEKMVTISSNSRRGRDFLYIQAEVKQ